jgi:hypothetical protein
MFKGYGMEFIAQSLGFVVLGSEWGVWGFRVYRQPAMLGEARSEWRAARAPRICGWR